MGWGVGGGGGIKVAGGVRVFNQLTLSWEMILSYPGGPTKKNVTRVLTHERGGRGQEGDTVPGLRMEGARPRTIDCLTRIWERQMGASLLWPPDGGLAMTL